MRKFGVVGLLTLLLLALGYGALDLPWRVAFNRTESLPLGLYLVQRGVGTVQRGDTVCFAYREPAWARGRYLPDGSHICKEVLGLPGDQIDQDGDRLLLRHDGQTTALGQLLHQDSRGRPVPEVHWGHAVISPDHYYLGSLRVGRSFDSRYLGLVARNDLLERISPLWVRQ